MTRTIVALFDTTAEAEQASQRLAMEVGGVRGEVYGFGRVNELSSLLIPGDDTAAFREGIRRGGAVLYAQVPDGKFEAVAAILDTDGAVNTDEREAAWQREGWTGVSATTARGLAAAAGLAGTDTAMPLVTGDDTTVVAAPVGTDMSMPTRGAVAYITGRTGNSTGHEIGATGSEETTSIAGERLRVSKRETTHGQVRIRSYIVETPVQEPVTLHEEQVQVERRPVGVFDDVFRDRTIEATETSEEAVVSKEARVKEEVVVRKTAEERTQTLSDTVRQTKVEVDDERGLTSSTGPGTTPRSNDPV